MAMVFYNKVKALADTLASIGQPLTDSEFNSYIINGLDEDYDGLVEIINKHSNTNLLMVHEVYSCLVLTKQRVEVRRANRSHGHGSSANAASRGPQHIWCPASLLGQGARRTFTATITLLSEYFWGGHPPRVCQLCGRDGHYASMCYRRFQRSFLGFYNDSKDTHNNARQAAMADRPAPKE
jgi:hypothetical protein